MKVLTPSFSALFILLVLSCTGVPKNEAFENAVKKNEGKTVQSDPAVSANAKAVALHAENPPSIKWITVNDMTENSFSLQMPAGWTNAALLHRLQGTPRSLVTTVAPDKNTVIYFGDPRLPVYTLPGSDLEVSYRQMGMKYPYSTGNYVDADTYFSGYLQKYFSQLEGFRIIGKFENTPFLDLLEKQKTKIKMDIRITTASYRFEYRSGGKTIYGELNGSTLGFGNMWLPEVAGFCTTGKPDEYSKMMITIAASRVDNPRWQEEQNEKHRQAMASIDRNTQIMTQQHQQRMANIQRNAAAHQQKMADLQQANDSRNEQWRRDQASQDVQHEKFVNVIKGEHTVMDAEGNTYQVDNGQDKYFVDKTNNTYIGTDGTKTIDDLRQIKHLNIDNFETVQIIR